MNRGKGEGGRGKGEWQHVSIRVMIQGRGMENEKRGNPIASSTGLLDEHFVQRKEKEKECRCAAFVPHTDWYRPVGIGKRIRTDDITLSDLYNETRSFYRLYVVPYKPQK